MNIYVYTFEAPQCTKKNGVDDSIYGNIVNIMNPNDYVPKFVMKDWGVYSLWCRILFAVGRKLCKLFGLL